MHLFLLLHVIFIFCHALSMDASTTPSRTSSDLMAYAPIKTHHLQPNERLIIASFDELIKTIALDEPISDHVSYFEHVINNTVDSPVEPLHKKILLIGKCTRALPLWQTSLGLPIKEVMITGDGHLACLLQNQTVVMINQKSGALGPNLNKENSIITSLCCDHEKIIGIINQKSIRIWHHGEVLPSNNQLPTYLIHDYTPHLGTASITSVQIMYDKLYLGLSSGEIAIYDLHHNTFVYKIKLEQTPLAIESLKIFSPTKLLAFTSCSLTVVDIQYSCPIFVYYGKTSAAAPWGSNKLFIGTETGAIELWDINNQQQIGSYNGHAYKISALSVMHGNSLVSGGNDLFIKLWHPLVAFEINTLGAHFDTITTIIPSNDEKHFITSSLDGNMTVWAYTPLNLLEQASVRQIILLAKLNQAKGTVTLHKSWYKEYKDLDPWLKQMIDTRLIIKQKNNVLGFFKSQHPLDPNSELTPPQYGPYHDQRFNRQPHAGIPSR